MLENVLIKWALWGPKVPLTKRVAAGCKMSHLIGKSHCLPAVVLEKNANKVVGDMGMQGGMP